MRFFNYFLVIVFLCFFVVNTASGGGSGWDLVWQDNFDRVEVGDEWILVSGEASVKDGRLLLTGSGATIITKRAFKPDVRIEFDAEAAPGAPPCDLSATIGASPDQGIGYLLAFGGQSNRVNQLLGPQVHQVDESPKLLIQPDTVYHLAAQREGKRFTYTVNGQTILDATAKDPPGGPGFDRVGLVTWNGMLVDNVRVYERTTPHPDTPVYLISLPECGIKRSGKQLETTEDSAREAVEAFNSGDLSRALSLFRSMGDSLIGLVGQAYVIGDLDYQEKLEFHAGQQTADFKDLAERFKHALEKSPGDKVLSAYAHIASYFPNLIMCRSGQTDALRIIGLGSENNPFYYKAELYGARYQYWAGAEGGDAAMKKQACDRMAKLRELWPNHVILKQYTGEPVPWGEELNADTEHHPAWAAYLREAYARNIRIMQKFFQERQSPDGQLGGGYGDDCELMRTWMQIAAISSASEDVRAGIERLAEGIWNNVCHNGFAKDIGDVEHSSEPSADTFPGMLLLRYGDPKWIERNMRSCKTIRDLFMGIDDKDYPRFKSSEYGASGIKTDLAAGGDTGYNARSMKHFIWQAWWGDPDALDWFIRWCDGWRASTMTEAAGKIAGVIPASIWYPSGEITPPGETDWCHPKLNYYGCPGLGGMIADCFLCAYYFVRDIKFLQPFQLGMDMATRGPLVYKHYEPGTKEWQMQCMFDYADSGETALYKWLTGERVYDEYTRRFGDAAQIYRTDYNLDEFMKSFERAAKEQRYNLELQTTEVLSTDRAALRGALTVFGAYTGAIQGLRDAATPTFAVTYDASDTDFAALVTEAMPERVRIWLYSFHNTDTRIGLRLWRMKPGKYIVMQGKLMPGEWEFQHRYGWLPAQRVDILHRADVVYVNVPPNETWVVDIRLDEPISVPNRAPDLAVGISKHETDTITASIHNVGNADAKSFTVALAKQIGSGWTIVSEKKIGFLKAPKHLSPSSTVVRFPCQGGPCRIIVDPKNEQYEICESNNICDVPEAD